MSLLETVGYDLSVSSVSQDDEDQFGAHCMVDGTDDTCWNSDKGSPQFVEVQLSQACIVKAVLVTFQGGYSGQDTTIEVLDSSSRWHTVGSGVFVDDSNEQHVFNIPESWSCIPAQGVRLTFNQSTDMFGRVSVYHLKLSGNLA